MKSFFFIILSRPTRMQLTKRKIILTCLNSFKIKDFTALDVPATEGIKIYFLGVRVFIFSTLSDSKQSCSQINQEDAPHLLEITTRGIV